jgi:isoleucyl-tRNA synthetase
MWICLSTKDMSKDTSKDMPQRYVKRYAEKIPKICEWHVHGMPVACQWQARYEDLRFSDREIRESRVSQYQAHNIDNCYIDISLSSVAHGIR